MLLEAELALGVWVESIAEALRHCSLSQWEDPWGGEVEVHGLSAPANRECTIKVPALAFSEHLSEASRKMCRKSVLAEEILWDKSRRIFEEISAAAKCSSYWGDGIKAMEIKWKRLHLPEYLWKGKNSHSVRVLSTVTCDTVKWIEFLSCFL